MYYMYWCRSLSLLIVCSHPLKWLFWHFFSTSCTLRIIRSRYGWRSFSFLIFSTTWQRKGINEICVWILQLIRTMCKYVCMCLFLPIIFFDSTSVKSLNLSESRLPAHPISVYGTRSIKRIIALFISFKIAS